MIKMLPERSVKKTKDNKSKNFLISQFGTHCCQNGVHKNVIIVNITTFLCNETLSSGLGNIF